MNPYGKHRNNGDSGSDIMANQEICDLANREHFDLSKWNDPIAWQGLLDGSTCPICIRKQPLDAIATLEASWVTMQEDAPVRGYVCLVSQTHAVELHDLLEETALAFMRDVQRVSKVIASVTGAVKLNYEIHGNSIPHLHMHFFPRYVRDQFGGLPIDPRAVIQPVYAPGEFEGIQDAVVAALAQDDRHAFFRHYGYLGGLRDWRPFASELGHIRMILLTIWDPVGILGADGAMDEYDSYAEAVLELIHGGADVDQVENHLVNIENELMGGCKKPVVTRFAAQRIVLAYKFSQQMKEADLPSLSEENS